MTTLNKLTVSKDLQVQDINGYSEESFDQKMAFHAAGKKFLKTLADILGLPSGTYDIRSNTGGMAVSGEVTLHSDDLYVQLSESCMKPGVQVMYRSCDSRKDYCGHQNHFAHIDEFRRQERKAEIVASMTRLLETVRFRKSQKAATVSA